MNGLLSSCSGVYNVLYHETKILSNADGIDESLFRDFFGE